MKNPRRFLSRFLKDPRVNIGIGTYGVNESNLYLWKKTDKISIGKYCSIAPDVIMMASGEHNYSMVSNYPFKAYLMNKGNEPDTYSKGPISIGNDIWIGYGATILSGVSIGDGAIIGARSLVIKDIPPYAIAAGVPARVIKYRFSEKQREALIKIAWWDWDEKLIKDRIEDFYQDIDSFIEKYSPNK